MPDKWAQYAQPTTAVQPSDVQKQPGDKWAQYAQPAEAAAAPPAAASKPAAAKPKPRLTDENGPIAGPLRSFGRSALSMIGMKPGPNGDYGFNDVPTDGSQTYGSKLGAQLHNLGNHAVRTLAAPILHPVDTLQSFQPQSTAESILGPGAVALRQIGQAGKGMYEDYKQHGIGAAGGDALGMYLSGKAADAVAGVPGGLKRIVTGDVNAIPAGATESPLRRFTSARNLGVNLDAADATGSPILNGVKKLGEHSLAGSHIYENLKGANTTALTDAMDRFKTGLYDGDREAIGSEIQNGLKHNQKSLQEDADNGFQSLPQDVELPGLRKVGSRAQEMMKENEDYQQLFPSLTPNRAMSVVGDVGGIGPQPPAAPKMSAFVDESGAPIPSSVQQPPPKPLSFGTGQKLRSDLLEFTRKNPDIVAGQGDAMVRELTGGTDDAMVGGESQLTPSQKATFRDANAKWRDMKETYDDPSSPFYHAVRTDNPSTLAGGVGPKTAENARNLVNRFSPFERTGPALGALRRGTVESALKSTNDGSPNFRRFGTEINRIPADYRAELFSPGQNETLRDMASTSNVLSKDFNPSGTAKQGQKLAEATALIPTGGAPLLQYPVAKFMTNPGAVDWLMKPSAQPGPAAGVAAAAAVSPKRKLNRPTSRASRAQ